MSQEKTNLEIIAPTVDEAVARGLSQLGLAADAVDVEILDAGSRGLFGLGARQARVRLTIRTSQSQPPAVRAQVPPPSVPREQASEPVLAPAPEKPAPKPARAQPKPAPEPRPAVEPKPAAEAEPSAPVSEDRNLQVARETVSELLEKMKVKASVTAHYLEPAESGEEQQILVDVQGDDLSILIGRRSETLNALQYIASLIVGKELEHWVPLLIDVQGYRSRRERQLRQLARRMADQAVQSGKRQVLEPMPSNERRVIHLELRDHPQVFTESTGEEPNRKVTISVKKA